MKLENTLPEGDYAHVTSLDDGRFSGYASIFEKEDEAGDTVARGAFAASLARRGFALKLLWQHDPSQPIGVIDRVYEDDVGLYIEGRLLIEVQRAREAAALLRAKAIDGLSIGYRTMKAELARGGGRVLREVDLWEVSLVTFPTQSGRVRSFPAE